MLHVLHTDILITEVPLPFCMHYNEVFLNTETTFFDRNRLYGGIGYRFNSSLKIEAGYMNQFFNKGGRDQLNIITFFNF